MLVRIFWITSLMFLMAPPVFADVVRVTDNIRTELLVIGGFVFLITNLIFQARATSHLTKARGLLMAIVLIACSFVLTFVSWQIPTLGFFVWLLVLFNAYRLLKINDATRNRNFAG